MKRGTVPLLVGSIFTLVGTVFLIVGIAVGASTMSFLDSAERTDGTVIELTERTSTDSDGSSSTAWYPTIEFTTPYGETISFVGSTGSNPPAHDVGDEVPVAYDPDNPSDAKLSAFLSLYLLPLIFGGIGVVFTPIGIGLLVVGIRKRRARAKLLREGTEVWAEITYVGRDRHVSINHRHPFVVRATWHDPLSGQTHTASSDYVTRDPRPELEGRTHVRVLYDPSKPDDSLVDLQTPAR